jgi:hypothetical protein
MHTKERTKTVAVSLGTLAGVLVFSLLATAGNLDPNGPPAPTMRTLDEIYEAVLTNSSGVSQREAYFQSVDIPGNSTHTFFTVPAGKRFVLLKVCMMTYLELLVNDSKFIGSDYFGRDSENGDTFEDFPDRCVIVNAGQTLKARNYGVALHRMTIIGYFYDVP